MRKSGALCAKHDSNSPEIHYHESWSKHIKVHIVHKAHFLWFHRFKKNIWRLFCICWPCRGWNTSAQFVIQLCLLWEDPSEWTPGTFFYQTPSEAPLSSHPSLEQITISAARSESSPPKPQSVRSDAQLKDVKLGFFYTVLVLAVSASKIILKRAHLTKKGNRPGSLTMMGRPRSPGVTKEDKRNRSMIRKAVMVVGAGGGEDSNFLLSWEPRRLRLRSCSTQVSCSAGPSVLPGLLSKLSACFGGEMWRRHKERQQVKPNLQVKLDTLVVVLWEKWR